MTSPRDSDTRRQFQVVLVYRLPASAGNNVDTKYPKLSLKWGSYPYSTPARANDGYIWHDLIRTRSSNAPDGDGARYLLDQFYSGGLPIITKLYGIRTADWDTELTKLLADPSKLYKGVTARNMATVKRAVGKYSIRIVMAMTLAAIGRRITGLGQMAQYLDLIFPPLQDTPDETVSPSPITEVRLTPALRSMLEEFSPLSPERTVVASRYCDLEDVDYSEYPRVSTSSRAGANGRGKNKVRDGRRAARGTRVALAEVSVYPHATGNAINNAQNPHGEFTDDESILSWIDDPSLRSRAFRDRLTVPRIIPMQITPIVFTVLQELFQLPEDCDLRRKCAFENDPFNLILQLRQWAASQVSAHEWRKNNAILYQAPDIDPRDTATVAFLPGIDAILTNVHEFLLRSYEYVGTHYTGGHYGAWREMQIRIGVLERSMARLDATLDQLGPTSGVPALPENGAARGFVSDETSSVSEDVHGDDEDDNAEYPPNGARKRKSASTTSVAWGIGAKRALAEMRVSVGAMLTPETERDIIVDMCARVAFLEERLLLVSGRISERPENDTLRI